MLFRGSKKPLIEVKEKGRARIAWSCTTENGRHDALTQSAGGRMAKPEPQRTMAEDKTGQTDGGLITKGV